MESLETADFWGRTPDNDGIDYRHDAESEPGWYCCCKAPNDGCAGQSTNGRAGNLPGINNSEFEFLQCTGSEVFE